MEIAPLAAAPAVALAVKTEGLHVVPDRGGVAEALAARCRALGQASPTSGSVMPEGATRIVLLQALSPCESAAAASDCVLEVFRTLRALANSHAGRAIEVIVAQNLGGDFGLLTDPGPRAILGAVAGLAKSAAREWPKASVRVLDLATTSTAEALAHEVIGELSVGATSELEIGVAHGARRAPRMIPVERAAKPARSLARNEVWLVSGGARGVTAACLQALARRSPLRFAILGRTPIDDNESASVAACQTDAELKRALLQAAQARGAKIAPLDLQRDVGRILAAREARASCDALRALGAEVRYFAVDAVDAAAVARVADEVRGSWGPIAGVVHAAGVLADKALREKTDAQFLSVYRTKVDGFKALLAATQADPLRSIVAFSSVAARAGNAGQCDYAAANEALNKLCQAEQHRRGAACSVRSINWGPWDGGMVSPGLKTHFAAMGVGLIPLAGGAEAFADIVTGVRPTTVECVVGATLTPASV